MMTKGSVASSKLKEKAQDALVSVEESIEHTRVAASGKVEKMKARTSAEKAEVQHQVDNRKVATADVADARKEQIHAEQFGMAEPGIA